jgi:non-homologous end joining protein Ku
MELFKDHVYLCFNADDYKDAVERALAENTEEKKNGRIAFARSHSWKNNVQQIYNQIEKLLN